MKPSIIISLLAIFLLSTGISAAMAASDKCVVVESSGKRIVLECRKETAKFREGTGVKIKSDNKGAAVEGC